VREPLRTGYGKARSEAQDLPSLATVARFVIERRRTVGCIFIGFSLLAAMNYAMGAWVPTFFIRTYGSSPRDVGYAFGLIYMVLGTLGVVVGGWLSDWLTRRGHLDANLRSGVMAGLCALPFLVALPLMPSYGTAMAALAGATFFGTMPFGAGTAAIPILAPNRMRAQLMALYLLVANLLGQGCGPTSVAALTDLVFHDPMQLRYSLLIATTSLLLCALGVLAYGLPSVRREIAALTSTQS
jgi:MFS family permease